MFVCAPFSTDITDESCEFTTLDEQNKLYFKVSGENATAFNGSDFLIQTNPLYFSQGTIETPILIETGLNTQLSASIGFDENSFYMIRIPANTAISFSLDVLKAPNEDYVRAQIYTDAEFSSLGSSETSIVIHVRPRNTGIGTEFLMSVLKN